MPVPRVDDDIGAGNSGLGAVAVEFHLEQPTGSLGHLIDESAQLEGSEVGEGIARPRVRVQAPLALDSVAPLRPPSDTPEQHVTLNTTAVLRFHSWNRATEIQVFRLNRRMV
jgi:hypothetical protein